MCGISCKRRNEAKLLLAAERSNANNKDMLNRKKKEKHSLIPFLCELLALPFENRARPKNEELLDRSF